MTQNGDTLYSQKFYQSQAGSSFASAIEVVPLVLKLVPAQSVCDVGCGVGTWLSAFAKSGVKDFHGFDGPWVSRDMLQIPQDKFTTADLASPIDAKRTFDLAISLEVAEHLPASAADNFVDTLTRLAPVVLFSAAIPHQGGTGHINEQWPTYWKSKFAGKGFIAIDCIRPNIWGNDKIMYWYRQNILLFASEQGLSKNPALREAMREIVPMPSDVVHPAAFTGTGSQPDAFMKTARLLPGLFVQAVRRRMRA